MLKLWNAFKDYQYKAITAFAILVLAGFLTKVSNWVGLDYIMGACGVFLFGYVLVGIFYAAKNTWNDGSKAMAIIFSTLAIAMITAIIYFIFFFHGSQS